MDKIVFIFSFVYFGHFDHPNGYVLSLTKKFLTSGIQQGKTVLTYLDN